MSCHHYKQEDLRRVASLVVIMTTIVVDVLQAMSRRLVNIEIHGYSFRGVFRDGVLRSHILEDGINIRCEVNIT